MATLEDLYSKYFPGQNPQGQYDNYNMSYVQGSALTPQKAAYKAAQSGNVDDWLQAQQWAAGTYAGADPYNNVQGTLQQNTSWNPLGFYAQQGRESVVKDALQAIAQSAGMPDYDWTPAINKASMQLAAEFGGQSPTSETRLPELIRRIAASAPDQQIQQTYQQIAPQINPVLEDQYTQIWNQSKDYKSDKFRGQVLKAAGVAALPIAGYYATGGAGAAGAGSASTAGGVTGAAGELGAGGAIGSYGSQVAASQAAAGAAGGAAAGTDASWGVNPQSGAATQTLPPLAETTGSNVTVGTAAGGNAAGPTVIGTATGAGPFVGAGGAMLPAMGDALSGGTTNGTFTPPTQTPPAQQGAYQFPWQNVMGAVLGYLGQQESGKTAEDLMRQMIESDQWRTQQSRYFEPLYEAATKGIGDTAYGRSIAEQSARQSAASGYNMSGNMLTDIAKSLHGGTMDYVRGLTPLATGRGESGAYGAFGPTIAKSAEAPYGMIGYGLGEIFRGQQPNNGTQNQTLIDLFR